jgi:hypothetical protein
MIVSMLPLVLLEPGVALTSFAILNGDLPIPRHSYQSACHVLWHGEWPLQDSQKFAQKQKIPYIISSTGSLHLTHLPFQVHQHYHSV